VEAGETTAIEVDFVGHATVSLQFGDISVLTDPFLRGTLGPLVRHGEPPERVHLEPDVVVISHGHPDHFDRRSLLAIGRPPAIVVPRGLGAAVPLGAASAVVELAAGEHARIGALVVRAVPARHWISPRAPRAEPIGYVIEADAGGRLYFAGDTGPFDAMAEVAADVDVALLPVWTWGPHLGPGHLGPRSAAEVLARIAPRAAVPIHWGTLYPRRLHHVWRRPLTEPGQRFAAHAARLAPEVDVRVLRPGERTVFELPDTPRGRAALRFTR
jgi:L-ascorbate metabolism protein UlaG (beta-lactamase superfamily)